MTPSRAFDFSRRAAVAIASFLVFFAVLRFALFIGSPSTATHGWAKALLAAVAGFFAGEVVTRLPRRVPQNPIVPVQTLKR
jgi:hypothetical protein